MTIGHLAQYAFKRKELEEIPNIDLRKARSYNLDELNALRRKLAKRANQRLRDIERAGLTNAYVYSEIMRAYLMPSERTRFFEGSRQLDIFTLRSELQELKWFLSAKTSTVGGIREFERKTEMSLRERFKSDNIKSKNFWKFMSSASMKHLKRMGVSSEELIEFYDFATEKKVSFEDIQLAIEEYEKNEIESWDELYESVGLNYIDTL